MKASYSTVSLFLKDVTDQTLKKALNHYPLKNQKMLSNRISFDLEDMSYLQIKTMLQELLEYLDESKRSQAMIFDEGTVKCVYASNNKLVG